MQPQLSDKVVIVTGASSGIGRAAATLFAAEGARLVLAGRREGPLADLARSLDPTGARVVEVAGDVTREDVAARLVAVAVERFGGLDAAFNNVGDTGMAAPIPDLSLADWRAVVEANLTSAFLAAKTQIPALLARGGGALLFTGTFVGHTVGFPGLTAYGAAKAGVLGLMRGLAAEYGAQGIRVNALLPGGTDTPMFAAGLPEPAAESRAFIENLHGLKRIAAPEEMARAALFLLSDAASFVTGATLLADGGLSVTRA
ncbi:SDR family oxidoreductase [Caenispirillum bisanense]|uniref:NAD(P)-dependent dehydrogenase, short-chain alcohol dehydrogenase family n=1 Tax=Caenispirillum bisanense TaxID=414052 RepID=A0A286GWQ7_9PROT|nr:SDR family oxidoreductase [Caenispirillum bisanense]SOD99519.1 NAD(P)-dependent dehydrogenase, short-chain alcohol dehydrogenase family [Caenispirillum bisanense]